MSRATSTRESAVVSVTRFSGGTTNNVIPGSAALEGTVRALNEEIREQIPLMMERIVAGIASAHGASYSFEYRRGPRPVVNDEGVTCVVEEVVRKVFGEAAITMLPPNMGSEDFSAYQQVIPGSFFGVGARNEEMGITYPNHHPRFDIDEGTLKNGVRLFVHAAFGLLADAK